jgi:hypothetical protein
MYKVRTLFLSLLVLGAFPLKAFAQCNPNPDPQPDKNKDTTVSKNIDVYKIANTFLANFPAGSDYTEAGYSAVLDTAAAAGLKSLCVTRVTNTNGHFVVSLSQPVERRTKKANIKAKAQLEFDYAEDASGKMTFTNVRGLEVKVNFLLGWMDVLNMEITRNDEGASVIDVQVKFWGGTVKHRAVVAPDGKINTTQV